jgi:hypothetical protein
MCTAYGLRADGLRPTALRRPPAASGGLRRPTAAYGGLRWPTAAYGGLRQPDGCCLRRPDGCLRQPTALPTAAGHRQIGRSAAPPAPKGPSALPPSAGVGPLTVVISNRAVEKGLILRFRSNINVNFDI